MIPRTRSRLGQAGAVLLALLLASGVAVAQDQTQTRFDGILDAFADQAQGWQGVLTASAEWLFFTLAIISFLWANMNMALRGGDASDFIRVNTLEVLRIGVMWVFLRHAYEWSTAMVMGFRQAGERAVIASGGAGAEPTLDPAGIFQNGMIVAGSLFSQMSIWSGPDNLSLVICALVMIFCFAFLAAFMAVAIVESYIVIGGAVLFLGFGGSPWTIDIAKRTLMYCVSIGAKLFALQLIVGVAMGAVLTWARTYEADSSTSTLGLIGLILLVTIMAKMIPELVQGMLNGASVGGAGAMLATGAAAVAAAVTGTAAVMTGGAAAAGAAGAGAVGAGAAGAATTGAQGAAAYAGAAGNMAGAAGRAASAGTEAAGAAASAPLGPLGAVARGVVGAVDGVGSAAGAAGGTSSAGTGAAGAAAPAMSAAGAVGAGAARTSAGAASSSSGAASNAGGAKGAAASSAPQSSGGAAGGAPGGAAGGGAGPAGVSEPVGLAAGDGAGIAPGGGSANEAGGQGVPADLAGQGSVSRNDANPEGRAPMFSESASKGAEAFGHIVDTATGYNPGGAVAPQLAGLGEGAPAPMDDDGSDADGGTIRGDDSGEKARSSYAKRGAAAGFAAAGPGGAAIGAAVGAAAGPKLDEAAKRARTALDKARSSLTRTRDPKTTDPK